MELGFHGCASCQRSNRRCSTVAEGEFLCCCEKGVPVEEANCEVIQLSSFFECSLQLMMCLLSARTNHGNSACLWGCV